MKKLLVANWKLNPQSIAEARTLASQVEQGLLALDRRRIEVVLCPPAIFLPIVRHSVHFALLGAQNISTEESGPFTGETSVRQIREFGAGYAIVGHSERRAMGESDQMINVKVKIVLASHLEPIICVGFGTKVTSTDALIRRVVAKQITLALRGIGAKTQKFTVAYEPVWAISRGLGTGKAADAQHAAGIAGFIKAKFPKVRVIYGGSLDANNALSFAKQSLIEGGLVGGASLRAAEFLKIIRAFAF